MAEYGLIITLKYSRIYKKQTSEVTVEFVTPIIAVVASITQTRTMNTFVISTPEFRQLQGVDAFNVGRRVGEVELFLSISTRHIPYIV